MWALFIFKLLAVLLLLLLLVQMQLSHYSRADAAVATASMTVEAEAEPGAEYADAYNIRHGRSKVRRSNEKEHILWMIRPQSEPANSGVDVQQNKKSGNTKTAHSVDGGNDGRKNATIVSESYDAESKGLLDDYDNELISNIAESAMQNFSTHKAKVKADEGSEHKSRVDRLLWSSDAASSIQTGNGHLFGSDYWRNSYANGTLISQPKINATQTPQAKPQSRTPTVAASAMRYAAKRTRIDSTLASLGGHRFAAFKVTDTPDASPSGLITTEAPVTHRIRKLHMKKIMESLRNSAGNSLGVKLVKNHHRSLLTAEQLQGRPMDVEVSHASAATAADVDNAVDSELDDSADREGDESLERADETVIDGADDEDEGDNFDSRSDDRDADGGNVAEEGENSNEDVREANESNGDDMAAKDASSSALQNDVDKSSDELSEVLQLADDLDEPDNLLEDDVYQNDDYIATSPSYVTTRSDDSATELSNEHSDALTTISPLTANNANSYVTEMQSDDMFFASTIQPSTLKPINRAITKLQLVPKTTRPTKLTLLPATPSKVIDQRKLAFAQVWKNQSSTSAKQNQISVIERPAWHATSGITNKKLENVQHLNAKLTQSGALTSELLDSSELHEIIGNMGFESAETLNNTLDYGESEAKNGTVQRFVAPAAPSTSDSTPTKDQNVGDFDASSNSSSIEPNQLASTSVGGIGLDRQQSYDVEEINFENVVVDNLDDITMDDGHMDNRNAHGFPVGNADDVSAEANGGDDGNETEGEDETNRFLAGVVDAANEDEIYDWDEISRNNRRNLMRGRDVVTKFLQIVETQHSLGANCEAGTSLNLGEGVVDRYAQDRFRVEAEVAVNRANMLTRIFKMTTPAAQADVNLLHASVLSMVEFDDDIFAAGNCFDWNEHPSQTGLFCPFAYRLPAPNLGAILAKDLSMEYHYLGNTSEWFFQARKNAEKVISRNEQYLKSFHLYSNKTDERIEYDTLAVKYEDGRWSKPYYDCGGGNIWMLTYTVPFFGYENGTYHFKGTSGIDIDLRRMDIDQCPQRNSPGTTQPLNIFAGTDKCKQRTTMCEALKGLGFRRGSYKCACRKGYYFPDTISTQKFFNGSLLEEEYEKLMLGKNSTYNIINEYECLPCAEGCDYCEDGSPCIAALNWPMRTSILMLACTVIGLLPPAAWFTFRYQQVKVVRAASPALLRVIALGAFFIYCTNIAMYPNPNLYTCTARIWLREIGFSLTYGALMLKTWRISVIFRVRSAKAVKITDAALLKRLGIICGVIGTCLLVRTLVAPPDVVVGRTADDLKAFLCKTDYWDYTFTSMEVLFLAWGVRLCIMVRKAPSEFNESRFISMAIYNEFLLTCFLNVSMLFLQSPANPDLLYIIFFCHTQLTVTLLLCLIFGSKVYIVLRSGKSHQETIGMGAKSSGAKFNFRPQVRTFANPSSVTTSTVPAAGTTSGDTKLSDQEALEEIRQLSVQLQRIQEMAPPKGVAVMTISSLLDGLKTPGGMLMVAAAASQAATSNNQLTMRSYTADGGSGGGALPLLSLNTEMEKYNKQLQATHNNNVTAAAPINTPSGSVMQPALTKPSVLEVETSTTTIEEYALVSREDRAINTDLTRSEDFHQQALGCAQGHIICTRCLVISKEHYFSCRPFTPPHGIGAQDKSWARSGATCQQLGSPQPEGSISFANIKLECMCSQPDLELDAEPPDVPQQRRRVNVRSAATNTPPSTGSSSRRRRSVRAKTCSPSWQNIADESGNANISYRICDNCKIKYRNSNKIGGRKFRKSTRTTSSSSSVMAAAATAIKAGDERQAQRNLMAARTGVSQTRSNDLLDRQLSQAICASMGHAASADQRPKVHSTDDIIFYTTSDESSTNSDDEDENASSDDRGEGACSRLRKRRRELTYHQSTSAISTVDGGVTLQKAIAAATSQTSVAAATSSAVGSTNEVPDRAAQSMSNVSNVSNVSEKSGEAAPNGGDSNTKSNGSGRAKRPDKLILDLNDRSKYTKEVSV